MVIDFLSTFRKLIFDRLFNFCLRGSLPASSSQKQQVLRVYGSTTKNQSWSLQLRTEQLAAPCGGAWPQVLHPRFAHALQWQCARPLPTPTPLLRSVFQLGPCTEQCFGACGFDSAFIPFLYPSLVLGHHSRRGGGSTPPRPVGLSAWGTHGEGAPARVWWHVWWRGTRGIATALAFEASTRRMRARTCEVQSMRECMRAGAARTPA